MATITARMKTYIDEHIYTSPNEIAEELANGSFTMPRGAELYDEVAARLAVWAAGEAQNYVDISDEEFWPLIATIAELAAITMTAMHEADLREAAKMVERHDGLLTDLGLKEDHHDQA
jgi:hypothetical protein